MTYFFCSKQNTRLLRGSVGSCTDMRHLHTRPAQWCIACPSNHMELWLLINNILRQKIWRSEHVNKAKKKDNQVACNDSIYLFKKAVYIRSWTNTYIYFNLKYWRSYEIFDINLKNWRWFKRSALSLREFKMMVREEIWK